MTPVAQAVHVLITATRKDMAVLALDMLLSRFRMSVLPFMTLHACGYFMILCGYFKVL